MKILDNHVHTHFSIDAKDTMEDVIKRAIDIGVDYLTFTDHLEYNTDHFSLDIPQYISKIAEYKDKYKKDKYKESWCTGSDLICISAFILLTPK